ncbi:MAG: hypothetical protein ACXVCD_15470 [Pseudobdellovibrionaceae bacterium]
MKLILSLISFLVGSYAFACTNISGTYKLDIGNNLILRITQNKCDKSVVEALDSNGSVIATKTDFYDGKLRNSEWVSGEMDSFSWNGNILQSLFYLKDNGILVESLITKLPNGDLSETQKEYLKYNEQKNTITWRRL